MMSGIKSKPIPIGIEFYKEMIDKGYYYIDKTMLIYDLLAQKSKITLFTRPRRFGKTLAQSMLQAFFEEQIMPDGTRVDNSRYFKGKKIMDTGEEYICHMGKYPVIFLSLKSAKQPDYEMAYGSLIDDITKEYIRHRYVLSGKALLHEQKEQYSLIMGQKANGLNYAKSIAFLSACLESYHHKKTVILIDEYDVPLENAYFEGFYDKMLKFMRSLFEAALKTNDSYEFAVVTGCLRISKESIFTGLNNLETVSVLDENYAEHFGFIQEEVDDMLSAYGISSRVEEVKKWYDGYLFGKTEVYNPWSMINYVKNIIYDNTDYPKPYWSNTSANNIVHELVEKADNITKCELEELVAGGTIEKPIHEEITYADIDKSQDNLWNFLLFTGYLKAVKRRFENRIAYISMKIPNEEILYIYENIIQDWQRQKIEGADFSELYNAIVQGDTEMFECCIKEQLCESISFMDSAENFYHGFLLGILSAMQGYEKLSNRESGEGRFDIVLKPYDEYKPAIILELKRVQKFMEMEGMCYKALEQIEEKHYDARLLDEGYCFIKKYGICFCKKSCMVKIKE